MDRRTTQLSGAVLDVGNRAGLANPKKLASVKNLLFFVFVRFLHCVRRRMISSWWCLYPSFSDAKLTYIRVAPVAYLLCR